MRYVGTLGNRSIYFPGHTHVSSILPDKLSSRGKFPSASFQEGRLLDTSNCQFSRRCLLEISKCQTKVSTWNFIVPERNLYSKFSSAKEKCLLETSICQREVSTWNFKVTNSGLCSKCPSTREGSLLTISKCHRGISTRNFLGCLFSYIGK